MMRELNFMKLLEVDFGFIFAHYHSICFTLFLPQAFISMNKLQHILNLDLLPKELDALKHLFTQSLGSIYYGRLMYFVAA